MQPSIAPRKKEKNLELRHHKLSNAYGKKDHPGLEALGRKRMGRVRSERRASTHLQSNQERVFGYRQKKNTIRLCVEEVREEREINRGRKR